jgi:hypothetical protein
MSEQRIQAPPPPVKPNIQFCFLGASRRRRNDGEAIDKIYDKFDSCSGLNGDSPENFATAGKSAGPQTVTKRCGTSRLAKEFRRDRGYPGRGDFHVDALTLRLT